MKGWHFAGAEYLHYISNVFIYLNKYNVHAQAHLLHK